MRHHISSLFFIVCVIIPQLGLSQSESAPIAADSKPAKNKDRQDKVDEKRKTPLVEDSRTGVDGKKVPVEGEKTAEVPAEESKGHFLVSVAATYSVNLHGIHNEDKDGQFYPLSVLLELGANDNISFETGLIFVERQYQVVNDNYKLQQNINRIHIPVNLKLWWRDMIAFGVGPYVAFAASGMNSYEVIRVADTDDLETPAEDFTEFGFEASLTFNVPLNDRTGIFVEARYFTPYDTIQLHKSNSIYGLAGVKYQW